jgi:hypothetical protein
MGNLKNEELEAYKQLVLELVGKLQFRAIEFEWENRINKQREQFDQMNSENWIKQIDEDFFNKKNKDVLRSLLFSANQIDELKKELREGENGHKL